MVDEKLEVAIPVGLVHNKDFILNVSRNAARRFKMACDSHSIMEMCFIDCLGGNQDEIEKACKHH